MIEDEERRPKKLEPRRAILDAMSVAELEAHIADLKMSLEEAREIVERKRHYRAGLDDVFGS